MFLCKVKTNKKMNKFTKAIAAIMLTVAAIVVAGCNKPNEPNNGENNGGGNNDSDVRVTTYTPQDITATTAKIIKILKYKTF